MLFSFSQGPAQFIRYTPSQQGAAFNSGAKQRVIRLVEAQVDPMEPPRFKINKKIPRGPPSPPAPVLHSPTRRVTVKEQKEWKIPPCISNWKNAKGALIFHFFSHPYVMIGKWIWNCCPTSSKRSHNSSCFTNICAF